MRNADSDSVNLGSNPSSPASHRGRYCAASSWLFEHHRKVPHLQLPFWRCEDCAELAEAKVRVFLETSLWQAPLTTTSERMHLAYLIPRDLTGARRSI